MILDNIIDRLGDSNPQLVRELKQRLILRNIGIAIAVTIAIQILVLIYFNSQLPNPSYETYPVRKLINTYSHYCWFPDKHPGIDDAPRCQLNALGKFNINWQQWWFSVLSCLNLLLPLGLILGSVYLLVADLVTEEKRGTLNFIRLSPQPTHKIFIGKIFGVPILVYLATTLAVPFHFWAGFNAGANLSLMVGWYVAIGSLCFLLASAAMLYVLLGGIQAIVTTMAVAYPLWLTISSINESTLGTIDRLVTPKASWAYGDGIGSILWFWLPVASNAFWFNGLIAICCMLFSYGIWQALDRRYLNPWATTIGKFQSYLLNFYFQIIIAGFVIPLACTPRQYSYFNGGQSSSHNYNYENRGVLVIFAFVNFLVLLASIPTLLPNKQALQNWSRYRQDRDRKFWQQDLLRDLIGNDRSPALLAIAINIGMAVLLWAPVALVVADISDDRYLSMAQPTYLGFQLLGCVLLTASLILLYAAIAHLGLFLRVKKRNLWTIAIIAGMAILPAIVAYILSPGKAPTGLAAISLLFSPFAPLALANLRSGTILATFAIQLGILGVLTIQLQRKLQQSSRSQTQDLLA